MIKKILIITVVVLISIIIFCLLILRNSWEIPAKIIVKEKPLLIYTFDNLKKTKFQIGQISLGKRITSNDDFTTWTFYYPVSPNPSKNESKTVSGIMNIPNKPGIYPVIVMFRGFVAEEIYQPGIGTQPSAKVFAKNGFITLAPDFLGFGESGQVAINPFESRFQTYTSALALLSSLSTLNSALDGSYIGQIKADLNKIGIWGHSNGGQIALTVLEISGLNYPTILWAPVSKPFPYSVLYYTDESGDNGKYLRKILADFETDYDVEKYSLTNYLEMINAPIQIHQGRNDIEVPVWWTDELVEKLKKNKSDVKYYTYPDSDHNLQPSGWTDAVEKGINFYKLQFFTN